MVKGLDTFRRHFADWTDNYVLIGGTAASLVMEEAGLDFRATKDLDIVLYVEALSPAFGRALWQFIAAGEYGIRQRSQGKPCLYRFHKPGRPDFPDMLELFSRIPAGITLPASARLTPLPLADELSSLSAILLDPAYYDFVLAGRKTADALSWIDIDRLIPLKASAWIDLSQRQQAGEAIDSRDIRKHRNDVFRLAQLLTPATRVALPDAIGQALDQFLTQIETAADLDLPSLGIRNTRLPEALARIRQAFGRNDKPL